MSAAPASGELTREQLLDYVKKQKIKMKKLEAEIAELKASSSAATAHVIPDNNGTLQADIQALELQLNEKSAEIFRLNKKVQALEESSAETSHLREKEKELNFQVHSLTILVGSLEEKVKSTEKKLADCREILHESEDMRDEESRRASAAEINAESSEKKAQELSIELERLRDESLASAQTLSLLNQRIRDLESELEISKHDKESLLESKSKIFNLEVEIKAVTDRESRLQTDLSVQTEKNEQLQRELEAFEEYKRTSKTEISSLLSQLSAISDPSNMDSTKTDLDILRRDLEVLTEEKFVLTEKLSQCQAENARLDIAMSASESELSKQNVIFENLDSRLKLISEEHSRSIRLLEDTKAQSASVIAEKQAEVCELEGELNRLKAIMSAEAITNNELIKDLKSQINDTVTASESLTTTVIDLERQLAEEQKKVEKVLQEKEASEKLSNELKEKSTIDLLAQISSLTAELDLLKAKTHDPVQCSELTKSSDIQAVPVTDSPISKKKKKKATIKISSAATNSDSTDQSKEKGEESSLFLANAETEILELKSKLESAIIEAERVNVLLSDKERIIESLKEELAVSATHCKSISEQLSHEETQRNQQENSYELLQQKLFSAEDLLASANINYQSLSDELINTAALNKSLNSQVQELANTVQSLELMRCSLLDDKESLTARVAKLSDEFASVERSNDALRLEIGELKNEPALAAGNAVKTINEDVIAQIEQLKSELADSNSRCEEMKASVSKKQALLQQSAAKTKELKESKASLETQVEALTSELKALKDRIEELNVAHKKEIEDFQSKVLSLEEKLRTSTNESEDLSKKASQLATELTKSKSALLEKDTSIEQLTGDNYDLKKELAEANDKNSEQLIRLESLSAEVESLRSQLTASEEANKSSSHKDDLESKHSECLANLSKYKEALAEVEAKLKIESENHFRDMSALSSLLETKIIQKDALLQESIRDASKLRNDLEMITEKLNAELSSRGSILSHAEEQSAAKLAAANSAILEYQTTQLQLQEQVENLQIQLVTQREEQSAKRQEEVEALGEKLKKLKQLLARTKNALQEKEVEVAALKQDIDGLLTAGSKRPTSIRIILQISSAILPIKQDSWVLIEEAVPHAKDDPAMSRWIRSKELEQWKIDGCVIQGNVPVAVDIAHSESLSQLQAQYESQIHNLKSELTETQQTFSAYKIRAQTALKRIGTDDHKRQADELSLSKQIESLESNISELNQKLSEGEKEIESIRSSNAILSDRVQAVTVELGEALRKVEFLVNEKSKLVEQLESAEENHKRIEACQREEINMLKSRVSHSNVLNSQVVDDSYKHIHAEVVDSLAQTVITETPRKHDFATSDAQAEVAVKTPSKLLLFQQVDSEVGLALKSLREENGRFNSEILELKGVIGATMEKLANQADVIADLEASLSREREFNASGRHINAEYLVNVLKKFFLSSDASERSKLVSVICSLLHLRGEETEAIVDKWTTKPGPKARGGGLVGWFMNPPIGSNATSEESPRPAGIEHAMRGETIHRQQFTNPN